MNDKMDRTGKWLCAGMLGLALTTTAARGDSAAGFFRAEAPSNGTVLVSMPFHPFAEARRRNGRRDRSPPWPCGAARGGGCPP